MITQLPGAKTYVSASKQAHGDSHLILPRQNISVKQNAMLSMKFNMIRSNYLPFYDLNNSFVYYI